MTTTKPSEIPLDESISFREGPPSGKRKSLHIEKTGSPLLRWVMCQAAWQLVKRSTRWRAIYDSLKARIGCKKAIVAISRRLLGVCFSVLKSQKDYCEKTLAPAVAA